VSEYSNEKLTELVISLQEQIDKLEKNKTDNETTKDLSETVSTKADTSALKTLQETHDIDMNSINNRLGTASLTGIGDGTITGAISSLNANAANKISYFDGSNEIKSITYVTTSENYTATQDCYALVSLDGYNGLYNAAYINGHTVKSAYSSSTTHIQIIDTIPLKKGDVLTIVGNTSYAAAYIIYGTKN
jgi:hypothetical protein